MERLFDLNPILRYHNHPLLSQIFVSCKALPLLQTCQYLTVQWEVLSIRLLPNLPLQPVFLIALTLSLLASHHEEEKRFQSHIDFSLANRKEGYLCTICREFASVFPLHLQCFFRLLLPLYVVMCKAHQYPFVQFHDSLRHVSYRQS